MAFLSGTHPSNEALSATDDLEIRLPVGWAARQTMGQAACANAPVTLTAPGN
jgi:hypothetical protein